MSDGAPFLADVLMGVCYLIGLLTVLAGIYAAVAAAFRYADRDVEERVGQALDLEDPAVQELAVERARRREWRP